MGLIRAAVGSVKGALADQWKDAVHCTAMDNKTIMRRGTRLTQTKGNPDIISNGSTIMVEENTCMLTIDNGEITNIVTEAGQYTFDNSSAPSIFAGQISASLKDVLTRFTYGGKASVQQKVVYINLMPLPGIPFGTSTPMPYFDPDYNTDIDLRFYGTFEIQIPDAEAAVKFYREVANKGSAAGDMKADDIFKSEQYKKEFTQAMMIALSKLSDMGIRYSRITTHLGELTQESQEATKNTWAQRGFMITNVAMGPVTLSDESQKIIETRRKANTMMGGDVQRANMSMSAANAMEAAAGNQGGAMMGFMGMNAAMNTGGAILNQFGEAPPQSPAPQHQQAQAPSANAGNSWKCSCGLENNGKFCKECGAAAPKPTQGWKCECGVENTGKFCAECGKPKPESGEWTCPCGVVNTGKFCSECGKSRA